MIMTQIAVACVDCCSCSLTFWLRRHCAHEAENNRRSAMNEAFSCATTLLCHPSAGEYAPQCSTLRSSQPEPSQHSDLTGDDVDIP